MFEELVKQKKQEHPHEKVKETLLNLYIDADLVTDKELRAELKATARYYWRRIDY